MATTVTGEPWESNREPMKNRVDLHELSQAERELVSQPLLSCLTPEPHLERHLWRAGCSRSLLSPTHTYTETHTHTHTHTERHLWRAGCTHSLLNPTYIQRHTHIHTHTERYLW